MTFDTSAIASRTSLPEALYRVEAIHGASPAQWHRVDGEYIPITYAQLVQRIRHVASGLIAAGFKHGDRIAILMENQPDWAVADYAILSIGAVSVPLYCSFRPQDMAYVLNDSGAVAVFTSGGKLLQNLMHAINGDTHVKHVYSVESLDEEGGSQLLQPMRELEANQIADEKLSERLGKVDRDTLATLVYTSGTTANPKGVMLTHGNILTNLESVPAVISDLNSGDKMLSFLPLAHALERTGSHFLPYSFGISVAFAERPDTVAKNLTEACPTIMIAVPRMLEVVRNRILGQVATQPAISRKLFHAFLKLSHKPDRGWLSEFSFRQLDRLVGAKVRGRFGGRLRVMISGGAPLSIEVAEFFEAMGLPVIEGYGLSESAPLLSVNPLNDRRLGSVGTAAKGVEINIAEDGEILARGANIMPGYWKQKQATKEALIDGWLHTGDIGHIDEDGYLYVTDRKKDIIVNSGGENIAPQRVEAVLVADEMIEQALVYGDQKPYLVALIVPNKDACMTWAKAKGLPETGWEHVCNSDILKKFLQTRINEALHPLNQFEQVRRTHLLPRPFTIEEGLLTPTMKIKRRQVYKKYGDILESLYN